MSFLLSKIVWIVLTPGSLICLLLLLAFHQHRRRPRLSRGVVGLLAIFMGSLVFVPVASWITGPLEARFPQMPLPVHVDGIIVLGGTVRPRESTRLNQPQLGESAERLTEMVELSRRYPDARLMFTGGSGWILDQAKKDTREADVAVTFLKAQGVDPNRLIIERDSRNTWENAVFSKEIAKPKPGETWLLITSGWHMPRSVGIFRKVGWDVVPHPVDYIATYEPWGKLQPEEELYFISIGLREWIGLVSYHLMGRTSAWYPAPEPRPDGVPVHQESD